MLYAVDDEGLLRRTPAVTSVATDWKDMNWADTAAKDPKWRDRITAITSYSDILLAWTKDGCLLRSNRDIIAESTGWVTIHETKQREGEWSVGLAVVGWMLFRADNPCRLWQLDLSRMRQPRPSS